MYSWERSQPAQAYWEFSVMPQRQKKKKKKAADAQKEQHRTEESLFQREEMETSCFCSYKHL